MDRAKSEGTLDVDLGTATEAHDGVNGIVHGGVAEWEVGIVNAIIDAAP